MLLLRAQVEKLQATVAARQHDSQALQEAQVQLADREREVETLTARLAEAIDRANKLELSVVVREALPNVCMCFFSAFNVLTRPVIQVDSRQSSALHNSTPPRLSSTTEVVQVRTFGRAFR